MSGKHPIIALWCVPRSVSTAFERMMAARGDFQIFSEPFSDAYYFGPERRSDRFIEDSPENPVDFDEALAQVHSAAKRGPVFFKDMAYHVRAHIGPDFLRPFTNVVLIRDPRLSLVSLYKRMPDFSREETGFGALAELVDVIMEEGNEPLFVMDGEVLRADPEGMCRQFCDAVSIPFEPSALEWNEGDEAHWNRWQDWFSEASSSTEFRPPQTEFDEAMLKQPEIQDALTYCLPHYEHLRSLMKNPHSDPIHD